MNISEEGGPLLPRQERAALERALHGEGVDGRLLYLHLHRLWLRFLRFRQVDE